MQSMSTASSAMARAGDGTSQREGVAPLLAGVPPSLAEGSISLRAASPWDVALRWQVPCHAVHAPPPRAAHHRESEARTTATTWAMVAASTRCRESPNLGARSCCALAFFSCYWPQMGKTAALEEKASPGYEKGTPAAPRQQSIAPLSQEAAAPVAIPDAGAQHERGKTSPQRPTQRARPAPSRARPASWLRTQARRGASAAGTHGTAPERR